MTMKLLMRLTAVCSVAVFLSCNIFSPKEVDEDKWYVTGEYYIIEGKKKMQDKKWEDALVFFDKAIAKDGSLSEAYFYRGKCILRLHDVDLSDVWDEINPPQGSKSVPFLFNPENDTMLKVLSKPYSISLYDFDLGELVPYIADTEIDSELLGRKRIYDAVCQSIKMLDTIYY